MSKIIDSIIGHAIGDAMGVPTEFCIREKLQKHPVVKMIGFGQHDVPAGCFSDDTSMELALIDSFNKKRCFDYDDIMTNFYYWLHDAKYTATDEVFDAGRTCIQAIINYSKGKEPLDCGLKGEDNNGNGSLMRILPIALYSYYKKIDENEVIKLANDISSLTHAHEISKLGCYIYIRYVMYLLDGYSKIEAYDLIQKVDYSSYSNETIEKYNRILKDNIKKCQLDDISSRGYVVDTLEASLWCLLVHDNFEDTILEAINLGNDTDTVAAITGSMAGIIYGINSIPKEWLDTLIKKDYILDLSHEFEKNIVSLKKDVLMGTIIGDIVGSRFEMFNCKTGKNFTLLHDRCRFTDDSVMTLAVAKTILNCNGEYSNIKDVALKTIPEVGLKYPNCGYGPGFFRWLNSKEHEPYGSYGNGAAMRVSPIAIAIKDIKTMKKVCDIITNLSHNHEDSINGAEAVCIAINMALNNKSKDEIIEKIEEDYFKIRDLKDKIMSKRDFHINCVETVKQALIAFDESYDYEDAIRNAVALGGDSDTIAAITGGIAAAYYGISTDLIDNALNYLDDYLLKIYYDFNKQVMKE